MVSFENFVTSMPPSLSELLVTHSFCFPFKIPDDPTAKILEDQVAPNKLSVPLYKLPWAWIQAARPFQYQFDLAKVFLSMFETDFQLYM